MASDRSRKTCCIPRQITLGTGVIDRALIDDQEGEFSVVSSGGNKQKS